MAETGKRWIASAMYVCLYLLCPSVGQTPDMNEDLDFQPYEGDIILTPELRSTMEGLANANANSNDPHAPQFAVVVQEMDKWSNGVLPYEISSSLGDGAVAVIHEAMAAYTEQTCITFRERTSEDKDWVWFYRGSGCTSSIGRIGRQQNISIDYNCEFKGIVMHEIFHALGRWHEQSRTDRDLYVRINRENVNPVYLSNFDKVNPTYVTTQGVPYDYNSIMHYPANAFSLNGKPTIEPVNNTRSVYRLGQRGGFSQLDIQHINALYCGGNVGEWSSWSQWSDCTVTCNGGTQTRVRTCVGGVDCPGSNIEGRNCNEEYCPQPVVWGPWSPWSGCSQSCGGGRRTRLRVCQNGNTCVGQGQQFESCNSHECQTISEWGEWGSWSDCSQTCQGGIQVRRRHCNGGDNCPGSAIEETNCNSDISCEPEWTECTKSCGGGIQFRTVNGLVENQTCNEHTCHNESCLQGLTHVGCYRLSSLNLDLYEDTTPNLSDDPFNRTEPVRKCGTVVLKDGYTIFALGLGMCCGGSNNLEAYTSAGESIVCQEGSGGYFGGYIAIDVYMITDIQSFQDSATFSEACGKDFCTAEEDEVVCTRTPEVSSGITSNSLLSVVLILACLSLIAEYL